MRRKHKFHRDEIRQIEAVKDYAMTTTNPTPTQQETREPEPTLLDRNDVLDAVALFCSNFETLGERFKKQLRNTIRSIPPRRAAVAGPRGNAATTARNRDEAQDIIMASEEALGRCYDAATRHDLASRITEALDAATSSPAPAERIRVEGEQLAQSIRIAIYDWMLSLADDRLAVLTNKDIQALADKIIAAIAAAPADNDAEHVCFTLNQERGVATCSRCGTRFWSDLKGTFRINHTCKEDR